MVSNTKKKELGKRKKAHSNVFDEYVGYLGNGNTDKIMRELRGDPEIDIDET